MSDSIQSASDSELLEIANTFLVAVSGDPTAYGLTAAQVTSLDSKKDSFNTALNDHNVEQAAAKSKTETKNATRATLEDEIRTLKNIAKAAGTAKSLMDNLGIPSSTGDPAPNATVPDGAVDTSERLRHTLSWKDAAADGNKRRPRGAMGCEIWMKLDGPPPTDEKECSFLTLDSATPYLAEFDGAQAGKMAHYLMRWRMRDGSTGAWGETISATITG